LDKYPLSSANQFNFFLCAHVRSLCLLSAYLLALVTLFFLLCARLIWKMNGNGNLYARTKYARAGEWKPRWVYDV